MKEAQTIDEVIQQLEEIVDWAKAQQSRIGFFAALYLKVTIKVKEGIDNGEFENGERMERFDVIFANRYINALNEYRAGQTPTESWRYAFMTSERWWPIVLQHLLLGMNAHINLDLGIAAAETSPGDQLHDLKSDFDRINALLASLVDGVQQELAEIWPLLALFNRLLGNVDDAIINFSMGKARDAAWALAEELAFLEPEEKEKTIDKKDKEIAFFAKVIRYPGLLGSVISKIVRLGERGSVAKQIEILE